MKRQLDQRLADTGAVFKSELETQRRLARAVQKAGLKPSPKIKAQPPLYDEQCGRAAQTALQEISESYFG